VFEGGRVAERGAFGPLVEQGGRFAELVRTQLTGQVGGQAPPPASAAGPVPQPALADPAE
jgi:ATP-binding cassette, subfamily B, beta-glucan exporter